MARKLKLTGFARFLIFLIIFAPIAFLGASYYNGEDGIQNLKNIIGWDKQEQQVIVHADESEANYEQLDIDALQRRVQQLEAEVASLKEELNALRK